MILSHQQTSPDYFVIKDIPESLLQTVEDMGFKTHKYYYRDSYTIAHRRKIESDDGDFRLGLFKFILNNGGTIAPERGDDKVGGGTLEWELRELAAKGFIEGDFISAMPGMEKENVAACHKALQKISRHVKGEKISSALLYPYRVALTLKTKEDPDSELLQQAVNDLSGAHITVEHLSDEILRIDCDLKFPPLKTNIVSIDSRR